MGLGIPEGSPGCDANHRAVEEDKGECQEMT
jgi:hypothetical protein